MVLHGFCETQQKDFSIDVLVIEDEALEGMGKSQYGTFQCDYVMNCQKCSLKECSILKENNIKIGDFL